jgi:hypothetical protein
MGMVLELRRPSCSGQPAPPVTPYALHHWDLVGKLDVPTATYQLTLLQFVSPLQGMPFQTPLAKCRLNHDNAGSSNASLRHACRKAQQLSHHIHSSVSDPAALISLPLHLTCHSAAIARNISADRLTPLSLRQRGQYWPWNPQVDGLELGGVAREASVKGRGGDRENPSHVLGRVSQYFLPATRPPHRSAQLSAHQ